MYVLYRPHYSEWQWTTVSEPTAIRFVAGRPTITDDLGDQIDLEEVDSVQSASNREVWMRKGREFLVFKRRERTRRSRRANVWA